MKTKNQYRTRNNNNKKQETRTNNRQVVTLANLLNANHNKTIF